MFWIHHRTSGVCIRASGMHLRGSVQEVFCRSVVAWLSRSCALSRAHIVQRILSDFGPHDNIVQRLYLLSINTWRHLIGSTQYKRRVGYHVLRHWIHTPFFVQFEGLIILFNVLGVQSQSIQTSLNFNLFWILCFVSDLVCSTTS